MKKNRKCMVLLIGLQALGRGSHLTLHIFPGIPMFFPGFL